MKLLDKMQNIEQIRNINNSIAPRLCPFAANLRRTFTRPAKRRSYVLFHNLFYKARRPPRVFARGSFITLQPDIEKYRKYVDKFDMSEEAKIGLIHSVWNIMANRVDCAFGDDPVQHCLAQKTKMDSAHSLPVLESGSDQQTD